MSQSIWFATVHLNKMQFCEYEQKSVLGGSRRLFTAPYQNLSATFLGLYPTQGKQYLTAWLS